MKRLIIAAAAAAILSGFGAVAPAQANMANPALERAVPSSGVIQVRHWRHHRHHRHWRHRRHWRCWRDRVRVRTPYGTYVYRTHRRCGWRRW